ncbi:hypothetical protein [Halorientalis litorea]|jgi:hypothetical protein|uniref:hypothetical protein n=1 Tax=Halorientalis litorea TaxID=2931977 RepID=UPI001FF39248|nr:hypothetical protein [Halorientalis litorea]
MERGTEREREALRKRWDELAARRRATTRFLRGLAAAVVGLVVLLLAAGSEVCLFTPGGASRACTPVGSAPATLAFGVVGSLALGAGLWVCLTSVGALADR